MSRGHETPPRGRLAWRRRSRSLPVVVTVLATLAAPATAVTPTPTVADSEADRPAPTVGTGPAARLVISGLDAVVGPPTAPDDLTDEDRATLPDSDAELRLLVENRSTTTPLDGARVVVELQTAVSDRASLRAWLDDTPATAPATTVLVNEAVPDVEPGGVAQMSVRLPGDDGSFAPDELRGELLRIRPLVVAVVRGRALLDEVRTAVVGVSALEAPPLETAVVVPVAHDPSATPVTLEQLLQPPAPSDVEGDGRTTAEDEQAEETPSRPDPVVDPELLPGGRVDRLTAAVAAAPPASVTVAPAAHTLESLVAAGPTAAGPVELLERLQTLSDAEGTEVVSMPYALASIPVLAEDDDARPIAAAAVASGRRRLESVLGTTATGTHLTVAPQTAASLDFVPGELFVTRWDDAAGVDLETDPTSTLPPAVRTAVAPSGRTLQVLVGDPWVERVLATGTSEEGSAVTAHRVVLETAAAWLEDPRAEGRPFAVVPPLAWDASGTLPTELTTRLATAPWLRLSGPTAVVRRTTTPTAGWAPVPRPAGALSSVVPELTAAVTRFDALSSAVPAGSAPTILDRRDEFLRAVSAWPSPDPVARAQQILATSDAALDAVEGVVTVPADTTVTLASERGVVPITVRREQGPTVDVVVQVRPQGRLVVEGNPLRPIRIEEGGTATVGVDIRALGTGTFPLAVDVRTPDGQVVLAAGLISVRATAVSTLAIGVIALVVVLLLVLGRRRGGGRDDGAHRHLEVVR